MPELLAGVIRWVGLLGLMALAGPGVLDGWILPGFNRGGRERSRRRGVLGLGEPVATGPASSAPRPGAEPPPRGAAPPPAWRAGGTAAAGAWGDPDHLRRSRQMMVAGGVVLALSALAGALVAAWEVAEGRPAVLARYFIATRTGRAALLQAAAGVVAALLAARFWPRQGPVSRGWIVPGLVAAATMVWNSHAGIRGGTALVGDGLHVAAVALWIGGLLRLALLDWERLAGLQQLAGPGSGAGARDPGGGGRRTGGDLPGLIRRFSDLGALAVLVVAVSGILAARRNLYGADALVHSPYGQALVVKLALVAVLLAIAAVNLFALRPWLERMARGAARTPRAVPSAAAPAAGPGGAGDHAAGGSATRRQGREGLGGGGAGAGPVAVVRRLVRAEAVAALAVLLASGILAVLPPADRPAAATETVTWREQVAGVPVELALVPGGRGEVTLSARSLGSVALVRGAVRLDMPEHPMGLYQVTLSPPRGRSTGPLEARAVLPMPGAWELSWTLALADGRQETITTTFEASGAPGNQRQGRLSLRAAYQSLPGAVQATVALVGLVEAAVLIVVGWRRLWPIPFGAGLVALAAGAWLLGQVAWIDAYPTTTTPNPLPPTPAVIEQGRRVFAAHCAACHGPTGRGDGPASAGMLPPPADLTGVHTRQHTDGDLFWWITHGIDGTAMPAFGDVLTEEERWAVIRFIRQLGAESR